ncbi:MAG: hypothetical protein ACRCYT_05465 [Cetobacterium sp.]
MEKFDTSYYLCYNFLENEVELNKALTKNIIGIYEKYNPFRRKKDGKLTILLVRIQRKLMEERD